MERRLMALRIDLTPPAGKYGTSEVIVGLGDLSRCCCRPLAGKKWCDVVAGDTITDLRDGAERTVLRVRIFRAYGAEDGHEVTSGRAWLRGE
jgi:hypothetical protein